MGRETKRFSEMLALWKVHQAGRVTPSAVAVTLGEIGIARSTAYSALQSLSEQGLVAETRTTTPGGASRITYTATSAAEQRLRPLRELLKGPKHDDDA
jgi:predicted transcriptional regulator